MRPCRHKDSRGWEISLEKGKMLDLLKPSERFDIYPARLKRRHSSDVLEDAPSRLYPCGQVDKKRQTPQTVMPGRDLHKCCCFSPSGRRLDDYAPICVIAR